MFCRMLVISIYFYYYNAQQKVRNTEKKKAHDRCFFNVNEKKKNFPDLNMN